ncbi:MAG: DeoR/GlpR family DNA-binding transcription regulator, partial [Clostridia bacterium]
EKQGKLKRVLGGAELADVSGSDVAEFTMRQKYGMHLHEKELVAARAAEIVQDGDCVFVDGGTSLAPLFKLLSQKCIQIVSNNHLILHDIIHSEANIIIIGGNYLPHFHMTVGSMAEICLSNFHFDHAFVGCSGVDLEKGMSYASEIETVSIKKIAIEHANQKHLLIDSSKLRFRAFCKFLPLSAFNSVICNHSDADEFLPENFLLVDERK